MQCVVVMHLLVCIKGTHLLISVQQSFELCPSLQITNKIEPSTGILCAFMHMVMDLFMEHHLKRCHANKMPEKLPGDEATPHLHFLPARVTDSLGHFAQPMH